MPVGIHGRREAKQLFRLCLVNGRIDENRVRGVVQVFLKLKHRNSPAILARFLRLVRLDQAQHAARVESAIALPPDLQAAIQSKLDGAYGPGLSTTFAQRRSLIGGTRIQVGSDVYDGSVLARLKALESRF